MIKDELSYRRHPGRCDIMWGIEKPGKKDGEIFELTECLPGDMNLAPKDLRARVEKRFKDDINYIEAFVFSRDGGHFITYTRKNFADLTSEIPDPVVEAIPDSDGGLELPDQRKAAALLPRREKPVRTVDASVDGELPADAVSADRPVRRVPAEGAAAPRAKRSGPTVHEIVAGKLPDPPLTGNMAALYSAYMRLGAATKEEVLAAVTWADPPPQIPEGRVTSGTSWLKAHGLIRVKE